MVYVDNHMEVNTSNELLQKYHNSEKVFKAVEMNLTHCLSNSPTTTRTFIHRIVPEWLTSAVSAWSVRPVEELSETDNGEWERSEIDNKYPTAQKMTSKSYLFQVSDEEVQKQRRQARQL